jgi:hypothetical protein
VSGSADIGRDRWRGWWGYRKPRGLVFEKIQVEAAFSGPAGAHGGERWVSAQQMVVGAGRERRGGGRSKMQRESL